jgi:hypothetical protein
MPLRRTDQHGDQDASDRAQKQATGGWSIARPCLAVQRLEKAH